MTGAGGTRVPIPHKVRKVIQELKKNIGPKHSEEFVYTTLKDCDMDPTEAGRRLKMIQDVKEIAGKHSVEDVYTMLKDCNMDPNEAAQRLLYIDTFHEVKKKHDRRKSINSDTSEGYKRTQGNQWRRNLSSGKEYGVTNRQERVSRLIIPGKETNAVNGNGTLAISNGSYSHKLAPELPADVPSSTSDTVVVSSKNTCAIGTIKCEIVRRSNSSKSNARLPADIKLRADDQVIEEAEDTRKLKSDAVEKIQISESLKPLSLLPCDDSSQVVSLNQDKQPPQLLNEPLKVWTREVMERISIMNKHSIPEEKSKLKLPARKPDATVSSHQSVIFPDNLHVPENFKNHFTFGSLDAAALDDSRPPSSQQNDKIAPEPCLKDNNIISSESDPAAALKHEQTKVEMMHPPPLGGVENPILQRDYGFGFMPHLVGPHFVHVDVPDLQNGSSAIASGLGQTPTVTATAAGQQNSIALSPPVFPYFRHQPFANYIPYNNNSNNNSNNNVPYFPPHLYPPQTPPHLFKHHNALFPHQPPPPVVPLEGKQVNLTTTPNHQDLSLSQPQDNNNNLHLPPQQGEDQQQVRGGQVANLLPNYFYQQQQHMHMGFSPGIYQQPFMIEQPQPMVPPQHAPQANNQNT